MFQIKISARYTISKTPYDLKGNSNNKENNIARPINTDRKPDLNTLKERKRPNKKTKRLYVKKKRNAGIL